MPGGWIGIFIVGVSLGFLGAGGAAIALPVLIYLAGMEPHQAIAVSLLLVGGSSAYGAALNARKGFVRWRAVMAFAPFGIAGSALGSRWSQQLSGRALLLMFSALLAIISVRMLLEKSAETREGAPRRWHWIAAAGFGIGVVTGLLGVGGGFVIVPAMVYFARLGMREAVAASLAVMAVNTLAAFASHAARQTLDWRTTAALLACAAAGMTLGVFLSHRTSPARLKKYFALLLLALAAFMAARNW